MAITVKFDDIVEGMEFQTEETISYLNRKTGEVATITDREFRAAEDSEPLEHFPERKFLAVQNNLICQR